MNGVWLSTLACALALGLLASPAQASRVLLSTEVLEMITEPPPAPPPDGQVEGACGAQVAGGTIYVSEYYRHRVDLFGLGGTFSSAIAAPNPLDGVCGLALAGGALYANEWHEGVVRLLPSVKYFDTGHESTGVAVDGAGDVYAVDRTGDFPAAGSYVAVYEPSSAPVLDEGQPLKIGLGSLGDAYGVAVSSDGRVYVADAASGSVKVFEPAGDPATPVATISHDFVSLRDGALAIDPTNGNLLVLDNLQPGFEHPEAAIDEFGPGGAFLGQITAPDGIVHGEPSGLAFGSSGHLYVTSGNSEDSNVFEFGPYSAGFSALGPSSTAPTPAAARAVARQAEASAGAGGSGRRQASASEVVRHGSVQVSVRAKLTPKKLPRAGTAPVRFSLDARIASTDGSVPPQLRGIEVEINRNGHIDPARLPVCQLERIQPSSTEGALEACRRSLVGEGRFSAKVLLTQQAPFPSAGKIVAFNGRWHGKPAILAHVFGTEPVPTSYTLPFVIGRVAKGTYGTRLSASLPRFTSKWGYVTGIALNLGRATSGGGYLTAGCPAPKGFGGASFPLAHASLSFGGGGPKAVDQTLTRSCGVR
jgi:DNA-binding beta-propeller fold protein YncE